eukprot:778863-Rhodomonas_salina.4
MPGGEAFAKEASAAGREKERHSMRRQTMKKPERLNPCVQCTATVAPGRRAHKPMTASLKRSMLRRFGTALCPFSRIFTYSTPFGTNSVAPS